MGVPTQRSMRIPTCSRLPSAGLKLTSSCRLDGLDLKVAGQRLEPDRAVRVCQVISSDQATNQGPSRRSDAPWTSAGRRSLLAERRL